MKIDESEREKMIDEMEAQGKDLWVELQSEVHYDGFELPIWILVENEGNIERIYNLFLKISEPYRKKFNETKFSVAFSQIKDGKYFVWNFVGDREIRSGVLDFPLGANPEEISNKDTSVFSTVTKMIEENRHSKKILSS